MTQMEISVEKPHLSSSAEFTADGEEAFHDRRLSDLLPADFIRQIGFDPDQFIFKTSLQQKMMRRATDPGLGQFDPAPLASRRASQVAEQPSFSPNFLAQQNLKLQWYIVELADCTINAYATPPLNFTTSDGVIVRDGCYLRYGRILKRIKLEKCSKNCASLQIVATDPKRAVGDFISGVSEIAQRLVPNFIIQSGANCNFISVEMVSYQARSLIRVKVSDADDPRLMYVMQKLIQVFGAPVEVYDDLSA
jgi:hypothetical protein